MAAKKVGDALAGFTKYFKMPWRITGPASAAEYKSHLPNAAAWRVTLPGETVETLSVPWADNEKIYNTRYYGRDVRRMYSPVLGGTPAKGVVDLKALDLSTKCDLPDPSDTAAVAKMAAEMGQTPEDMAYTLQERKAWAEGMPPLPGQRTVTMSGGGYRRKRIDEDDNNGYE